MSNKCCGSLDKVTTYKHVNSFSIFYDRHRKADRICSPLSLHLTGSKILFRAVDNRGVFPSPNYARRRNLYALMFRLWGEWNYVDRGTCLGMGNHRGNQLTGAEAAISGDPQIPFTQLMCTLCGTDQRSADQYGLVPESKEGFMKGCALRSKWQTVAHI